MTSETLAELIRIVDCAMAEKMPRFTTPEMYNLYTRLIDIKLALKLLYALRNENADLRQQLAYYAGGDGKGLER